MNETASNLLLVDKVVILQLGLWCYKRVYSSAFFFSAFVSSKNVLPSTNFLPAIQCPLPPTQHQPISPRATNHCLVCWSETIRICCHSYCNLLFFIFYFLTFIFNLNILGELDRSRKPQTQKLWQCWLSFRGHCILPIQLPCAQAKNIRP